MHSTCGYFDCDIYIEFDANKNLIIIIKQQEYIERIINDILLNDLLNQKQKYLYYIIQFLKKIYLFT